MEETKTQSNTAPSSAPERKTPFRGNAKGGNRSFGGRPPRRGGNRPGGERARPEYDQKTLTVRRVTRVVAGGRRFAFSVALVTGNKKGNVGVGIGKAGDTALAIQKALANAKKNMITLSLTKTNSIPLPTAAKNSSANVMLFPNNGRGLVAGSAVRIVLELAGVKDVTSKVLSPSKNQLNIARAAIDALKVFQKKQAVMSDSSLVEESVKE